MIFNVFETGANKWLKLTLSGPHPIDVVYVSDPRDASFFNLRTLKDADSFIEDFTIYKNTLHAVPVGGNMSPRDYPTVKAVLVNSAVLTAETPGEVY